MREIPSLYLVVPCYNEEEVIEHSAQILNDNLCKLISEGIIKDTSKVIFVNDGSKDKTSLMITEMCHSNSKFGLLNFSRNFGHQAAILAGMLFSREYADCTITIDADLQQDIGKVPVKLIHFDRSLLPEMPICRLSDLINFFPIWVLQAARSLNRSSVPAESLLTGKA